ncbi:MAG: PD40 domain-containing protein [Bradymonadaceae bacterium]|nr:PD40 domain-containing protein [Lujinxingiaceae bacterium]
MTDDSVSIAFLPGYPVLLGQTSPEIVSDGQSRTIAVDGLTAGRWYGFSLVEQGEAAAHFACATLADNATLVENRLLIDLPLSAVDGIQEFSCSTSHGPISIRLNYKASAMSTVSGWRLGEIGVLNKAPAISADGQRIAWFIAASQIVVVDRNGSAYLATSTAAGMPANSESDGPSLSADGRYIAFTSAASNLVEGTTTPNQWRLYRKDLESGEILLVSQSHSGVHANANSGEASISPDGRYVSFQSLATNLVDGATTTTGRWHVYRKDLESGEVILLSQRAGSSEADFASGGPRYSPDGKFVVFGSLATNFVAGGVSRARIYRKNLQTGELLHVSETAEGDDVNANCSDASIASGGRYVSFSSVASNLVPGTDAPIFRIYRKDLESGELLLVSQSAEGTTADNHSYGASISADGKSVVFFTGATNLVAGAATPRWRIYRKDLESQENVVVSELYAGGDGTYRIYTPSLSSDGRYVAFNSALQASVDGVPTGPWHIHRKDLANNKRVLASESFGGASGDSSSVEAKISSDGKYVAFESAARNFMVGATDVHRNRIYRKDLESGEIRPVSQSAAGVDANAQAQVAAISSDGRYVIFISSATNLVAGASSVMERLYRKDVESAEILLVAQAPDGAVANNSSWAASLSSDGRYAAFASTASNLVDATGIRSAEVYRRDFESGEVLLVSYGAESENAYGGGAAPSISADGRYVAYVSATTRITIDGFFYNVARVYRRDLESGEIEVASQRADGVDANWSGENPSISSNGRYVLFGTRATNLVSSPMVIQARVYRKDLESGQLLLVSSNEEGVDANALSGKAALSADARYAVFESEATNLVAGTTTPFRKRSYRKSIESGAIHHLTQSADGAANEDASLSPSLSFDGEHVVFASLVPTLGYWSQVLLRRLPKD